MLQTQSIQRRYNKIKGPILKFTFSADQLRYIVILAVKNLRLDDLLPAD